MAGDVMDKLDADQAKLWLDDEKLDRIIAAVGETPTKPDRDMLRCDLLMSYGLYSRASAGQSGHMARQIRRLNSMQKHAKKLADLLRADAADAGMIRWPINPMRPAHIVTQIDCLIEMIDQIPGMHIKPAELAERIKARRGVSGSPLQWLIGTLLPDVYSKHFGRKAGISRNQNGLGGPYIRFTRQVLIEIEIDCSDEMIASVVHGKILKK